MSKMLTSSFIASALLWMHRDILHQILSYAMLPSAMAAVCIGYGDGRREIFYNQAYLFVKRVGNKDGLLDIKLDVLFFFGF